MLPRSHGLCVFVAWIMLSPGLAQAVNAPQDMSNSSDNLALVYNDRNHPLDNAAQWIASAAAAWKGQRSAGPDFSFIASGEPVNLNAIPGIAVGNIENEDAAVRAAYAFARSKSADWPDLGGADFLPLNVRQIGNLWHVTLQQAYQSIPVYGSRLDVRISADGYLAALSVRLFPPAQLDQGFSLTSNSALSSLTDDPCAQINACRQIFFPLEQNGEIELLPAWQLRAVTDRADYRPAGIVDARNGQVLVEYNDVAYDEIWGNVTGLVLPHYWNDPPQVWDQKYQQVTIIGEGATNTDVDGNYAISLPSGQYSLHGQLYGYYVNVNVDGGPEASYDASAYTGLAHNWLWDYNLARQDEVNMYYHTTLVHDFYKVLEPDFTALDYPLPATVSYGTNYENAFWNGSGIFFGEGGSTFRNFALFCDVIYHEYSHGVTDMIYPWGMLPYIDQPGAMNEAWSDYFACTITDEPLIGEGGLYTNGQVMRNLDNTLVYPDDWVGEVHADGRIISGAFWDLREALGAALTDSLLHFSKYSLAETFEDYFLDVLVYDDDDGDLSNGGPHHAEIYEAFGIHGIGPGVEPVLGIFPTEVVEDGTGGSVGNGDGFFDPNEILSMTFSVTDFRYLYPPEAENVTVTASTDDPDLSLSPESFTLGNIAPGETVQAPESLMITVSPQADISFSQIFFDISANGGSYTTTDQVEIIVGHPPTLLVDDDGGDEFQQYLDVSLRNWGQVFSSYPVASQGAITLDYLSEFQVVIWLTGNAQSNTLTDADRSNLAAYLDAGHSLLLTGQNLVEDIGTTTFFADYLGASPLAGDVDGMILDGVQGDPITDSLWVMILGAGSGNNQTSPGAIAALPGAEEIFHYRYDPENRPGAVRYNGGNFKTVTFAFGVEAISGLAESSLREEVLTSVLAWFGLETGITDEPARQLPAEFALGQPYPNPFNAQVTIPLQLPQNSHVKITLYNLQGQNLGTVANRSFGAGSQAVRYDASHLSSGMYFLKIQVETENGNPILSDVSKIMLLK